MNHFAQSLRYFIQTVDAGSLTAAAQGLSISQSAISQQIVALEKELGAKLFLKKDKTGLLLSKAGELLYQKGKAILESFDALVFEIKGSALKEEHLSSFALLLEGGAAAYKEKTLGFLSEKLGQDIEWFYAQSQAAINHLLDKDFDGILSFQPFKGEFIKQGILSKQIASFPVRARFSAYSFFANMSWIELGDLKNIPLFSDEKSYDWEKVFMRWAGLDEPILAKEHVIYPDQADALEQTMNNRGFLLADPFMEKSENEDFKDIPILLHGLPLQISLYLIYDKKNANLNLKESLI